MKVQVRKRKPGQAWSLAHNGMLFVPGAAAKLIGNYQLHGYEAETVDVPAGAQSQTFY